VTTALRYGLFLRIDDSSPYVAVMLSSMLLIGTGFARSFPSLNIKATAGVADREQGLASSPVNTSFPVRDRARGGQRRLAVVSAVVTSRTGSALSLRWARRSPRRRTARACMV
jgi:hypothetical protein